MQMLNILDFNNRRGMGWCILHHDVSNVCALLDKYATSPLTGQTSTLERPQHGRFPQPSYSRDVNYEAANTGGMNMWADAYSDRCYLTGIEQTSPRNYEHPRKLKYARNSKLRHGRKYIANHARLGTQPEAHDGSPQILFHSDSPLIS